MIRPLIIYIVILHAVSVIHALTKDCSIKVFCVQLIRVVLTALLEYINLFIKIAYPSS